MLKSYKIQISLWLNYPDIFRYRIIRGKHFAGSGMNRKNNFLSKFAQLIQYMFKDIGMINIVIPVKRE